MNEPRKINFVSYTGPDGPENSYYNSSIVQSIEMRYDGRGPMGSYDIVHVTLDDGTLVDLPAHNCNEIHFI